ncbi:MAG: Cd2+/Zn2+-exporting ATPase [Oceanicoccus sp.]|jgi:Cd2+/Zn2+-exporting ATPase
MSEASNVISSDPLKVKIIGMDCGSCAMTIEDSIRKIDGVNCVEVSFTTESIEVDGDTTLDVIEARLKELGYKIGPNDAPPIDFADHRGAMGFLHFLWGQPLLRSAIFVAIAVIVGLLTLNGVEPMMGVDPLDALFIAAVLFAGGPVFLKGFRALIFAHRITIDLLMAIASVGALGIDEYGEAVTVILLFMLGEALEAYSAERARDSLRSLMALQPQEATVLQVHSDSNDHSHQEHGEPSSDDHENDHKHKDIHEHTHNAACDNVDNHTHQTEAANEYSHEQDHSDDSHQAHDHTVVLPVDQVSIGDRVLVRPGQRIPVDGEVITGISTVDQAPVTGESVPVLKQAGDEVMAGTVNGEAALEIRTTKLAAEGTIARIAKLVEQAQAQRSPAERFIDKFARWYTPAVVALASLVVLIPVYGFGQPLLTVGDTTGWLYRGLAMLIIACPCALVISIPVTVVSGLTRLANLGVLVKGGAQLDRLADITAIAFDKTGTLTHGKPKVVAIRTKLCSHPAANDDNCGHCDNVVAIAAAIERSSEHPVAHAIVQAAKHRAGVGHLAAASSVHAHPGKGVSGELEGGRQILVGSGDLFNPSMTGWSDITEQAESARNEGQTIMYIGENDKLIGYIGVHDEVREDSSAAIQQLTKMNLHKVMLTGDHQQAAQRVAAKVGGIDDVRAQLMPDEKLKAIEDIQQHFGSVAMVGDGINDAPALARADIGIAMGGGGTAQAMETADVVLMQDDLNDVAFALRMARKSRAIVKQNIMLSLILKLAFLGLAIPGIATIWMAVLADVGATLLVTMNGMRLLRENSAERVESTEIKQTTSKSH